MEVSVPRLLSDVSADATNISLDMPGGGYDRLHDFLERLDILPQGKARRTALMAATLVATRLAQQQLGTLGPVANFVNELGQDAVREQAKRILETATVGPLTIRPPCGPGIIDRFATRIFPWLKDMK